MSYADFHKSHRAKFHQLLEVANDTEMSKEASRSAERAVRDRRHVFYIRLT